MKIADTNVILRFLLNDNEDQFKEAEIIFDSNEIIYIPQEIIAEVIYVLQKVYSVSREIICSQMIEFLSYPNISIENADIIKNALVTYANSNLSYADCIVYSQAKLKKSEIFTFDKGLLNFFKRNK